MDNKKWIGKQNNNEIIKKLFIRLLPVQVLISLSGSVTGIVNGAFAGRCIDAATVGVVGLYYPMSSILDAAGAVLLGGTAVLCGRSMGNGDVKKTSSLFSLNIILTTAVGAVITAACFIMPGTIAGWLGAGNELKAALATYITGYAIGIIPRLLAQQVAAFLQMERQSKRGFTGVFGMIICNIVLDYILVYMLGMGVWGLALATSASNWLYLLLLIPYYFTSKAQLRFSLASIDGKDSWPLIKIGLPGAMLMLCLSIRGILLNRILLHYSGVDGVSAIGAFNMVTGIFVAVCLGSGAVIRMLSSVFYGESDRDSLKSLLSFGFGRMVPFTLTITALVLVLSGPISALFFPDKSTAVYGMTLQLIRIYAFCIPLVEMIHITSNYMQATGHNAFVHVFSVTDGLISTVGFAWLLAPSMGATGVWLANPLGMLLTLLLVPAYAIIRYHRLPKSFDEWLLLESGFGVPDEDRLDISIRSIEEVVDTAAKVQPFCEAHGVDKKTSYYAALCLEETAGNVVEHGFNKDKWSHSVNVRVVVDEEDVLLRIKDDCIPFDPKERAEMTSGEDPFRNIGIKLVLGIADKVIYQQMLGLNVLSILLDRKRGTKADKEAI